MILSFIVMVGMEAEYADIIEPPFYARLAYWYTVGHLPCGWEGEFPNGKLVLF